MTDKKACISARRTTIENAVIEKFNALSKPVTVTQMFWEIFPDAPEGKETVQKWNDINRAITKMVNEGLVTTHKEENKRRTRFSLVKVENAPEGEEGEGI